MQCGCCAQDIVRGIFALSSIVGYWNRTVLAILNLHIGYWNATILGILNLCIATKGEGNI